MILRIIDLPQSSFILLLFIEECYRDYFEGRARFMFFLTVELIFLQKISRHWIKIPFLRVSQFFFSILLQNEINPVAIRKEQEIAIKITREDGARSWVSFDQVKLQSVDNIGRIRYMVVHKPGVSWHGFVDDGGISKKWTKFQFTNFGPEMFTDTGKRRPLHKGWVLKYFLRFLAKIRRCEVLYDVVEIYGRPEAIITNVISYPESFFNRKTNNNNTET